MTMLEPASESLSSSTGERARRRSLQQQQHSLIAVSQHDREFVKT